MEGYTIDSDAEHFTGEMATSATIKSLVSLNSLNLCVCNFDLHDVILIDQIIASSRTASLQLQQVVCVVCCGSNNSNIQSLFRWFLSLCRSVGVVAVARDVPRFPQDEGPAS